MPSDGSLLTASCQTASLYNLMRAEVFPIRKEPLPRNLYQRTFAKNNKFKRWIITLNVPSPSINAFLLLLFSLHLPFISAFLSSYWRVPVYRLTSFAASSQFLRAASPQFPSCLPPLFRRFLSRFFAASFRLLLRPLFRIENFHSS